MSGRFDYVKYDVAATAVSNDIIGKCVELETLLDLLRDSREKSLAITELEQFAMWAGKAVRSDLRMREAGMPDGIKLAPATPHTTDDRASELLNRAPRPIDPNDHTWPTAYLEWLKEVDSAAKPALAAGTAMTASTEINQIKQAGQ